MDEASRRKRIRCRLIALGLGVVLAFCCCHGPVERLPPTAWPEDLRAEWGEWKDLRVAVHVHSEGSPDATGSVEDIVAAAVEAGIDVVLLTDHDARPQELHEGLHGEVLVIVGEEEGTAGGSHVLGIGQREDLPQDAPHEQLFAAIRKDGGLVVAAHPARGTTRDQQVVLDGADLVEVYSLSTDTFALGKLEIVGKAICVRFAPESTAESIVRAPEDALKTWDAQLARRPLTGLGAADSHGRYGFFHALALKLVQTHVLVRERTRPAGCPLREVRPKK